MAVLYQQPRFLVVGGGGREAAIAWRLRKELPDALIFCAPGNDGIAARGWATSVPIKVDDIDGLVRFVTDKNIFLTIVGPELPLVLGLADRLRAIGKLVVGPSAAAARAEASKRFFKEILLRAGAPTAPFKAYTDPFKAITAVHRLGFDKVVVKADGLCAGKGVVVPQTNKEAEEAIRNMMIEGIFGAAGRTVLIERRLSGPECSVIGITDGDIAHIFPTTRDHKRLHDGDKGPNTGGMGARTLPSENDFEVGMLVLVTQIIQEMRARGCPYQGFFYLGIMRTERGPMVLEWNCRLGDPEAQVILSSVEGDFADVCEAAARGNLVGVPALRKEREAVCVVLASSQYPSSSNVDVPISGLEEVEATTARVFPASIRVDNGISMTNRGGRIASVVGTGSTIEAARVRTFRGVEAISFPGIHYRRDI